MNITFTFLTEGNYLFCTYFLDYISGLISVFFFIFLYKTNENDIYWQTDKCEIRTFGYFLNQNA